MKKALALLAISIILCTMFVCAEGITPGKVTVEFAPNLKTALPFTVKGYENINIETDCPEVTYNNDAKKNPDNTITFSTTLILPNSMDGPKECGVKIIGTEKPAGLINTKIDLIATVVINAPYKGEHVNIDLTANNANKGDPINFKIIAENLGDKTAKDAQATIELTKDGKKVTTISTGKADIHPQGTAEFTKEFDTATYEPGKYLAVARLNYKDKTATDAEELIIGALTVDISSYPIGFVIGKTEPFDIGVESLWGKQIEGAYATATITGSNYENLAEMRTASTTLAPWQKTTLSSQIDTTKFKPGNYNAKINLFYEGKVSTKTAELAFRLPETPKKPLTQRIREAATNPILLTAIIALIVIIDIFWLMAKRAGKKSQET